MFKKAAFKIFIQLKDELIIMRKIILIVTAVILVSGCKKNDSIKIEGNVNERTKDFIYISKVNINTPILVDSAKVNNKGKFRIRVKTDETDFYQIGYSSNDFVTLLAAPGEEIKINFNGKVLSADYSVTGSEGSDLVKVLDRQLSKTKIRLDSLQRLYNESSSKPGFDTTGPSLDKKFQQLVRDQRIFNIGFIINNTTSLASVMAVYQKFDDQTYVLNEARDLQYLKIVSDSLKKYYPDSKHTKALISDFEKEMGQLYSRQLANLSASLPETKLDPNLVDINGRRIALSSLKGKYVLLTFWSSESKECIAENLQLLEYYKTYKRNGFEIYQISLDTDEARWRSAVKFDELPWISTREDDPAKPLNARLFNVKSLPANYLFDARGEIIATNLHGKSLQLKLNQIFNK